PNYYTIGVKSYGRAPTFLLATGYEQARSVAAALAGDWHTARDLQLDLPETGVCSSNIPTDSPTITADGGASTGCCGPTPQQAAAGRGLATGIAGGLLSTPLPLVAVAQPAVEQAEGCCG